MPRSETVSLPAAQTITQPNIAHNSSNVPQRRAYTGPENVAFTLYTVEVVAEIDLGETYRYWTFNRTVPGPMLRVMKGDNVTITIVNSANSTRNHSVDLHAVIGPGGGSVVIEFTAEVAGEQYYLVDHSLTRAIEKGSLGQLIVSGTSNPGIYGFP